MPFIFPYRNKTYVYDPRNGGSLRVRTDEGLKELNVNHPSVLAVLEHALAVAALSLSSSK